MSKNLVLKLNKAPVRLSRDDSATLTFAPAAELLVSFENKDFTYTAAGSYSQGGERPIPVPMYAGQLIPSSHAVLGNGSNITLSNTSSNPNSVITGGVFGIGEPTSGFIQEGQSCSIGQFQSILAITTPSWQKFRLTTDSTNKETVVYVFSAAQKPKKPQGYVLNYTGTGNTDFKTTTGNQYEEIGNWQGNALFFINVSNSTECQVEITLTSA
ncbi:hypothetical protein [Celerinatantimonas diazotrophica]|uniref:Uncharacterized protein n=1 Tax=Celerinatantimonas diazotrophica TaxID=412034 RepID=A0A4R1JB57_9GAMM|nr:hypothetical protein [Celerinatantimonas diazotrophica]TCK47359.1 hypothetical protein EV690_2381 [Celerinatantimonas diazotrophica]CAG9295023.1 hypothetical protein CEDIAZO_00129 [Celerinatantimonas diazotrophica]